MSTYRGLKIVTNPYLVEQEPVELDLIDKFFLFVEKLCNEADIYYCWRKVETTREVPSKKVVVMGGAVYVHPQMLASIKATLADLYK